MGTKRKRRRRRSTAVAVRRNPTTHRRRRRRATGIRRNPLAFLTSRSGGGGIVNLVTSGAKDAGLILAGKAATNYIARMIPSPGDPAKPSQVVEVGKRVAIGLGLGYAAKRFMSADAGRLVIAGAFLSPIESAIKAALPDNDFGHNIAGALASDDELAVLGEYYQRLGSYVESGTGAPININGATRSRLGDNSGSNMDQMFNVASGY